MGLQYKQNIVTIPMGGKKNDYTRTSKRGKW